MMLFDLLKGLDNLKKYIKIAPCEAGVYRMISSEGEVLYVGKAKNIKKRITRLAEKIIKIFFLIQLVYVIPFHFINSIL